MRRERGGREGRVAAAMWRCAWPGAGAGAAAFVVLVGVVAAPGTGSAQEQPGSVMIVFDGSGSMAGNIEGVRASKLLLAREAVRRGLGRIAPQTRIGLSAFGHRRGDCGDVEVVRPVEPLDAQRMTVALDKVNPRGRGPLTYALREAAKALPPPGKRSLILIHDDADNCQQNVCAVADELRRAGVTLHVVGLGLKPDDAARMACGPQQTGGKLFNARNAEQINSAVEEALQLASGDPGRADPPAAGAAARIETSSAPLRAAIPVGAPAGLYLRAVVAANTEPVSLPLNWTVYAEGQAGQPGAALFTARAINPRVPVPPGRYIVEVREGALAVRETVVAAGSEPTPVYLVLNAGTLHVRAQVQKSGAPLGDALISVTDAGQGGESNKAAAGAPLALFKGSEGLALLAPGRYLVRVEQGLVRAERAVVVPAGSQGRIEIALNAARVLLAASGRDTSASAEPVMFSVVEDDPDAPKGKREVARSAARQADFVLPPGTYYVIARQGGVEAREGLAVGPGDVVRRTLSVASARLALASRPVGAAPTLTEPVSYRVERIDGPAEVMTTSRAAPVLLLPAGRYRIEGRYGAMNARSVREVELKTGQTQQLTFEHQAATLKLRLTANSAPVLSDVFWDVRDETGATVWTTGHPEPQAVLQAGRYRVRAETRDKRYERAVELRPGEPRVVELAAD